MATFQFQLTDTEILLLVDVLSEYARSLLLDSMMMHSSDRKEFLAQYSCDVGKLLNSIQAQVVGKD